MPTGIYARTDECRESLRLAHLGKKLAEEHKKKIGVSCLGRHWKWNDESRRKFSIAMKGTKRRLGIKHTEETKKKMSLARLGKYKGEKAPNWKGGTSRIDFLVRSSSLGKKWKKGIFKRDNYTCNICGLRGVTLNAHHKKRFSKLLQEVREKYPMLDFYEGCMRYDPLWDLGNGITLCENCHKSLHYV
jgi:hypothetical protein